MLDITTRRQAEAAFRIIEANLRQAQKMKAIGQLTGGLAHELSTMLTARGETVLLVEDDMAVRMTFAITLEDLGYRVLQAADAEAALATLAATEVNVLLTDLRMPGRLDGLELVEVARAGNPELPVVVAAGYLDLSNGRRLPADSMFLQKPCSRVELALAMRRALDQRIRL